MAAASELVRKSRRGGSEARYTLNASCGASLFQSIITCDVKLIDFCRDATHDASSVKGVPPTSRTIKVAVRGNPAARLRVQLLTAKMQKNQVTFCTQRGGPVTFCPDAKNQTECYMEPAHKEVNDWVTYSYAVGTQFAHTLNMRRRCPGSAAATRAK